MNPRNPFALLVSELWPNGLPEEPPADASASAMLAVAAAELWELLDTLPNKDEATLAQRRLEEAVFWAGRAGA